MSSPNNDLNGHLWQLAIRGAIAVAIAFALPLSHALLGADPSPAAVDGPNATGFLIIFVLISFTLAAGFFIIASVVHAIFRRRLRWVCATDLLLGFALIVVSLFAGITATYSSTT